MHVASHSHSKANSQSITIRLILFASNYFFHTTRQSITIRLQIEMQWNNLGKFTHKGAHPEKQKTKLPILEKTHILKGTPPNLFNSITMADLPN